jgi:hypothetical protein
MTPQSIEYASESEDSSRNKPAQTTLYSGSPTPLNPPIETWEPGDRQEVNPANSAASPTTSSRDPALPTRSHDPPATVATAPAHTSGRIRAHAPPLRARTQESLRHPERSPQPRIRLRRMRQRIEENRPVALRKHQALNSHASLVVLTRLRQCYAPIHRAPPSNSSSLQ